jgi:hypothetical protein
MRRSLAARTAPELGEASARYWAPAGCTVGARCQGAPSNSGPTLSFAVPAPWASRPWGYIQCCTAWLSRGPGALHRQVPCPSTYGVRRGTVRREADSSKSIWSGWALPSDGRSAYDSAVRWHETRLATEQGIIPEAEGLDALMKRMTWPRPTVINLRSTERCHATIHLSHNACTAPREKLHPTLDRHPVALARNPRTPRSGGRGRGCAQNAAPSCLGDEPSPADLVTPSRHSRPGRP